MSANAFVLPEEIEEALRLFEAGHIDAAVRYFHACSSFGGEVEKYAVCCLDLLSNSGREISTTGLAGLALREELLATLEPEGLDLADDNFDLNHWLQSEVADEPALTPVGVESVTETGTPGGIHGKGGPDSLSDSLIDAFFAEDDGLSGLGGLGEPRLPTETDDDGFFDSGLLSSSVEDIVEEDEGVPSWEDFQSMTPKPQRSPLAALPRRWGDDEGDGGGSFAGREPTNRHRILGGFSSDEVGEPKEHEVDPFGDYDLFDEPYADEPTPAHDLGIIVDIEALSPTEDTRKGRGGPEVSRSETHSSVAEKPHSRKAVSKTDGYGFPAVHLDISEDASPARISSSAGGSHPLLERAQKQLAAGELLSAFSTLAPLVDDPQAPAEAFALVERLQGRLRAEAAEIIKPYLDELPRIEVAPEQLMQQQGLDHRAGYLLSQIDGGTPIDFILDLGVMPRNECAYMLLMLSSQGLIAW